MAVCACSSQSRAPPEKSCDLFNQLAKKLDIRLAASFKKSCDRRLLGQNRLPLSSARGQHRPQNLAPLLSPGLQNVTFLFYLILVSALVMHFRL